MLLYWTMEVYLVLMNEWMKEWCIYIALYCVLLNTQSALQSCGGVSPQPPPVCSIHLDDATAATGQRRQCAHHTPATGGEERESESQSSGWGLLGGHHWKGPVVGIWPGHWGYTPSLYGKCHGIFNDHRESGPRFNISSEIWTRSPSRSRLMELGRWKVSDLIM